jgi:hypothetical protein
VRRFKGKIGSAGEPLFVHLEVPMRSQLVPRPVRALLAGLTALAVILLTPAPSSALPTAEFAYSSAAPASGEPVTFTFTGSCDVPPCSVVWTWFQDGGSSLGTRMGVGNQIAYTFGVPGLYSVVAKITNATSTHGSASITHALMVGSKVQETNPVVGLGSWTAVPAAAATQGGIHAGAGNASLSFQGTRVDYVARTGPNRGIARVTLDGRTLPTEDLYAPVAGSRTRSLTGLAPGNHVVRVSSSGTRNPASSSTAISLDEFVVDGTQHVDDSSLRVSYSGWAGRQVAGADGGSVRASAVAGSKVRLRFTGTSVAWETATGPDQGIARIMVDGLTVATLDEYSPVATSKVVRSFTGLGAGQHQLQVVVLGQHRAASTGSEVVVDAFVSG